MVRNTKEGTSEEELRARELLVTELVSKGESGLVKYVERAWDSGRVKVRVGHVDKYVERYSIIIDGLAHFWVHVGKKGKVRITKLR